MLNWLPASRDFRAELRGAQQAPPAARIEKLRALAQHRLDFLETLQLDRALQSVEKEAAALSRASLAILSSSTVEHLLPGIRIAGLRRGLHLEVHRGAYGQYRQEILQPPASLREFAPNVILFSVTAREAMASVPLATTVDEVERRVTAFIAELRMLWSRAREAFGASIIQQTFVDITEPVFGSFDRLVPGAPARVVARLNERLADAAMADNVSVLDIARASERDGRDTWFSVARWLQAKQEIAPPAGPMYGELLARIVAAQRGLSKKCLVLDLDNTLWGGVVGDDGLQGIVLGDGSAAGEAHAALQRYAKQLKERGVVLAVCSRNEHAVAVAAVEQHPEMVLRLADFAAFKANWNDKAENLQAIATELNIGIDSLVFVDDNPAERARIRAALPIVAVPELPGDVADYVRCIADAGYFEAVSFTPDDRQRADQYAANAARETFRDSLQSMEDFLRGLEMRVVYGPFAAVDLPRVTQLINKTNQFNTTGRRYTAEEVAAFASRDGDLTFQFRLADRFGDNGLVSAMIFRRLPQQPDTFELDTWVMSCRVFGRELEYEAMSIAVEAVRSSGARVIVADYVPTAKNAVISGLYAQLGFIQSSRGGGAGEGTRWQLALSSYVPRNTSIERRSQA